MNQFSAKGYQRRVLESVAAYFRECQSSGDANKAFYATTLDLWGVGSKYQPLAGFDTGMPYFCLRIPTGGGKTWLAAKSVASVNAELLHVNHSIILWLTPSKAIREQTLKALRDRDHPYHAALREAGPVTVLDLDEAKSLTRATVETSTVVIVVTRQAFQVEDEDNRKVYESNGSLMSHFENLSAVQRGRLLRDGDVVPYSLVNVLRLRRPFVIVDEAHNSRTELAFDTLSKFDPSGIMELTATPDMVRTPSNVLHSVSAAELKVEEMIKLPIVLETEQNWQQCLADAIARREELHRIAELEQREGAAYLRPIVLVQAQPRDQNKSTLHADAIRQELIENHAIPIEEIVVATGEEKGLERVEAEYAKGIADENCPVKYIITQKALAEGWDCPFAYVLASMASVSSSTAVEQLLGRILRQPEASHRQSSALNRSYAYVSSTNFGETAKALRDRLVESAGFERKAAEEFVTASKADQAVLDLGRRTIRQPVSVELPEKPALKSLDAALREKIDWNRETNTLTISEPLTDAEKVALRASVKSEAAKTIVDAAAIESAKTIKHFQTPAEAGERFFVPRMSLRIQGELELFEDSSILEADWELSPLDASPTPDQISRLNGTLTVSEGGEIDVDETSGMVVQRFMAGLQRDLGLAYRPENWDETRLARWICENIPQGMLTHEKKMAFVVKWMADLLRSPPFTLALLNQQKFLLRNLLEARIQDLKRAAARVAYQQLLFSEGNDNRVVVDDAYAMEFHPYGYAPSRDYDGRFGHFQFEKHYYGRIGDFDSGEEFQCAVELDKLAQQGRILYWVRNLVRKEQASFHLQKADGQFFPDFICKLSSERTLIVEYKGANHWNDAEDDRRIGDLWAAMSNGRCRFVMVKDKRWDWINGQLG